jgi:hypothetical protein
MSAKYLSKHVIYAVKSMLRVSLETHDKAKNLIQLLSEVRGATWSFQRSTMAWSKNLIEPLSTVRGTTVAC